MLHVSYGGLNHGGVCAVIFSIVETLYTRFDFGCVVFRTVGDREKSFEKYGRLHRLSCYRKDGRKSYFEEAVRPFRFFFGIYRIFRKYDYQIIHTHNGDDEGICLLAAKAAGVQMRIAHSHTTPSPKKLSFPKRIRSDINKLLVARCATHMIGCSEAACTSYYLKPDYQVIYNSVDLSKFSAEKTGNHNGLRFIHVGRYCYDKNQSFVLKVFSCIHSRIPDSRLSLIGFGDDKRILEDEIADLELEDSVKMLPGDKVSIPDSFSAADYMIFPSLSEGFGIVLLEAQASGCFCFASDAVQDAADVGLMMKISLDRDEYYWADTIIQKIHENKPIDSSSLYMKLLPYAKESIANQYDALYRNV